MDYGYGFVPLQLDVLDGLPHVELVVGYMLDGKRLSLGSMPSSLKDLERVEVVRESKSNFCLVFLRKT
jgi:adenylosuccinate synthase